MNKQFLCWIPVFLTVSLTGLAQIEINQASAQAGTLAGDAPGFPVDITEPGSYKLTSNLTTGSESGINIFADNVWIDLNGFTIQGSGVGIRIYRSNARITNGSLVDYAIGLWVNRKFVVEDVHFIGHYYGVLAGSGQVLECSFIDNDFPINFGGSTGYTVKGCYFRNNGSPAILERLTSASVGLITDNLIIGSSLELENAIYGNNFISSFVTGGHEFTSANVCPTCQP